MNFVESLEKVKNVRTPISEYKKYILRYMRQFWKSENAEMWCGVYTFIKIHTEGERIKMEKEK